MRGIATLRSVFSSNVCEQRSVWRLLLVLALAFRAVPAFAAAPGEAAPTFALPTASGETIALEKLRGRIVYVDFWASWCGPCRQSFPWMNEMQARYGGRGLAIVAINVDKKRSDAERFLGQVPASFPIVYDPAGATPASYAVRAMPSSYLIDAGGKIVDVELGFRDERKGALEERIRALTGAR
jgi:thiol-disulfide isomerase/thioredoxin